MLYKTWPEQTIDHYTCYFMHGDKRGSWNLLHLNWFFEMMKEKIHTDEVGFIDIDSDSAAYIKIYDRLKIELV